MGELLGVEFGIQVVSSLGMSGGYVERKLYGSSVEFDRGIVGMIAFVSDAVAVAAVVALASAIRPGVR